MFERNFGIFMLMILLGLFCFELSNLKGSFFHLTLNTSLTSVKD